VQCPHKRRRRWLESKVKVGARNEQSSAPRRPSDRRWRKNPMRWPRHENLYFPKTCGDWVSRDWLATNIKENYWGVSWQWPFPPPRRESCVARVVPDYAQVRDAHHISESRGKNWCSRRAPRLNYISHTLRFTGCVFHLLFSDLVQPLITRWELTTFIIYGL